MRKGLVSVVLGLTLVGAAVGLFVGGVAKKIHENLQSPTHTSSRVSKIPSYSSSYADKVVEKPVIRTPRTLEDFFLQNEELECIKIPKGDFISPQIVDKVEDYGPAGIEYPYDSRALRGGSKVYIISKIEEDSEEREFSLTALEVSSPEEG